MALQGRNLAVFVAGHVRVGINQQRVVRIDAKPGVHGTHQPAHGHNGRSDQYRANGNLHYEQDVPRPQSSCSRRTRRPRRCRFNHLVRIHSQNLTNGNNAKEESTHHGEQERKRVDVCVGIEREIHRKLRKRSPRSNGAQQNHASPQSQSAARKGDQQGFGEELPQDACASGAQRKPEGNFAGAICRTRGKQAAQIGARRQQDQTGHEHQPRKKRLYRAAKSAGHGRVLQFECEQVWILNVRDRSCRARSRWHRGRHPPAPELHPASGAPPTRSSTGLLAGLTIHRSPARYSTEQTVRERKSDERTHKPGRRNADDDEGMLLRRTVRPTTPRSPSK